MHATTQGPRGISAQFQPSGFTAAVLSMTTVDPQIARPQVHDVPAPPARVVDHGTIELRLHGHPGAAGHAHRNDNSLTLYFPTRDGTGCAQLTGTGFVSAWEWEADPWVLPDRPWWRVTLDWVLAQFGHERARAYDDLDLNLTWVWDGAVPPMMKTPQEASQ